MTSNYQTLTEDFLHKRKNQTIPANEIDDVVANDLLIDINNRLQHHNKTTTDFQLGEPDYTRQARLNLMLDQLDPHANDTFNRNQPFLNTEQQHVFQDIAARLESGQGGLIFVDAPGNVIKSFSISFTILSK